MQKFEIDPSQERLKHEKILENVDPSIAGILRKHLTYPPSQSLEEKESTPKDPLTNTRRNKGPGLFIENSLPENDR